MELSGGTWNDVASGGNDLTWNLRNAYEQNGAGTGGNPVQVGEIVAYSDNGDGFVFERSAYRGTYPPLP